MLLLTANNCIEIFLYCVVVWEHKKTRVSQMKACTLKTELCYCELEIGIWNQAELDLNFMSLA